jgi:hypothetical protein
MKLGKLIAPVALIAMLAVFAARADAQTMGEYATTTAGVGSGSGSMGTAISSSVASTGGGSSTWGASSVGASFDQRAGSASGSSGSDFESRAGSSANGSSGSSRWPQSKFGSGSSSGGLGAGTSSRWTDSTARFSSQDRFTENSAWSSGSSDRFPASSFNDNRNGFDTNYNAINNY